MLHLRCNRSGPGIIGHVYYNLGTFMYKPPRNISKYIFKTDRRREFHPRRFEHSVLASLFPKMIIMFHQQLMKPRKCFFIRKMLGEGHQMRFSIYFFKVILMIEKDCVIIHPIVTSIRQYWGKVRFIKLPVIVTGHKGHRLIVHKLAKVLYKGVALSIGPVFAVPVNPGNKRCFRPYYYFRIMLQGLFA